MEYDLEKMVLDILSKHRLPYPQKDRFSPEDIAERYGIHKDNARRMINNGDFGAVIEITPRNKVVTLDGLLEYEARHTGFVSGKPDAKIRRKTTAKNVVGRI